MPNAQDAVDRLNSGSADMRVVLVCLTESSMIDRYRFFFEAPTLQGLHCRLTSLLVSCLGSCSCNQLSLAASRGMIRKVFSCTVHSRVRRTDLHRVQIRPQFPLRRCTLNWRRCRPEFAGRPYQSPPTTTTPSHPKTAWKCPLVSCSPYSSCRAHWRRCNGPLPHVAGLARTRRAVP